MHLIGHKGTESYAKMQIIYIFLGKSFAVSKNCHTFATAIEEVAPQIGLWCNGNTADSGPAFPGSSPGSPTKKEPHTIVWGFLA